MTTLDAVRSTLADVDLDAIASNVEAIRARSNADVIAVVKADAYGHGAEAVAEACFEAGAVMLAVATVEEGLALREGGVNGPILVLFGPTDASEVPGDPCAAAPRDRWDLHAFRNGGRAGDLQRPSAARPLPRGGRHALG